MRDTLQLGFVRFLALVATGVAIYCVAVAARRHVYRAQWIDGEKPPPFTLESALHARRIRMVYEGMGLPRVDRDMEYPQGLPTFKSDTVGAEYVVGMLARWWPSRLPLSERIRWISVLWFALAVPLLGIWSWQSTGRPAAGLAAACYYAVGLAAVIRSTGQEVMRENFAIPLLVGHWVADVAADRALAAGRRRAAGAALALSGLLLGGALLCWDLIQFYLAVWALSVLWQWFRVPFGPRDPVALRWWVPTAIAFALAGAHPYYQSHGFLMSPLVWVSVAAWAAWGWTPLTGGSDIRRMRRRMAVWLVLAGVAALMVGTRYQACYGHFAELLWAKIRFLNRKPADPTQLTFAQRILWTPALHSADWSRFFGLFPFVGGLTVVGLVVYWVLSLRRRLPIAIPPIVLIGALASFGAFVLFVRFHVYAALFAAGLVGWFMAGIGSWNCVWRWLGRLLLVSGLFLEGAHTVLGAPQWGRWGADFDAMEELADWMRAHVAPEAVAAHFTLSAFLLAEAGCPILMHPKFESVGIRKRVEEYVHELFSGTEHSFRDWCERNGARYYVHVVGEFSPHLVEYQMRYMAGVLDPPDTAPARIFEQRPRSTTKFRLAWANRRYRVFRVVWQADETAATEYAARGEQALEEGRLADAEVLATVAVQLHPGEERALRILRLVGALRAAGFEYEPVNVEP